MKWHSSKISPALIGSEQNTPLPWIVESST
jgi:hypothetical protein